MSATTNGYTPDELIPDLWHRDGVPWDKAMAPGRWHRCWSQSMELTRATMTWLHTCACGAVRTTGVWHDRNSRRKP